MNLRRIANGLTQAVNPNVPATLIRSTGGYATDAAGHRTPAIQQYQIKVQVQGLSGRELQHLEGLNVQGVMRAVYLYGDISGVVRADQKGGDVLKFREAPRGSERSWRVVQVLETWPDWCKVAVVMQ